MLDPVLVVVAFGLALWIFLTTVNISRLGWVAIPTADDWDRWISYVRDHYSLWWFFQEHVDHRLAAPKVLFAIDHLVFHARGWFLLVCAFCFQALTGVLLWWIAGRAYQQGRLERLIQAAVIVACFFSAQQWKNFVWPFQVQFPMVYCAAAAALFTLWKTSESSSQPDSEVHLRNTIRWLVVSIAMAIIATYSMVNGILVWPMLLIVALWLRMSRQWIGTIAAGALVIGTTYFYHWHKMSPPSPLPPSERLHRAVIFGLAHLGSPTAPLAMSRSSDGARLAFAEIPGALVGLAVVVAFAMIWRRRERYNGPYALLVFYSVFLAATSVAMAYGRSGGPLLEAFSSRYLTPSYILWVCILLIGWPLLRQVNHSLIYGALCAAIFLGIAVHQQDALNTVRDWVTTVRLGEAAVIDDVTDPDPWRILFHTPAMTTGAIEYLKANNLAVFTEEWTHWPGIPLNRRFSIDHDSNACQGQFEQVTSIPSSLSPGWRVSGWGWDTRNGQSPRYIILGDDSGQVAGVALTGFPPPPGLSNLSSRYTASNWNGYVNGQLRTITAYVLEANQRSLCAIGTQHLYRTGTEVSLTELGPLLPDAKTEIAGAWIKDGYYLGDGGPGHPPVQGQVFGSYAGADANTGTVRLGPFHLDGHTSIAIPLVTGPGNHGLSVVVYDAASKEVLAKMDPMPAHVTWWAWHPDLPMAHEITIEVVAEDKGTGWGEWQALGWPHMLRQ